jgi:succinate dehydrogenase/fumarate reductase flavoprotein subunit
MLSVFGRQAKVAVVGGGAAGLCAAIEAAKLGASVVIFDKVNKLGGNSAKASSGINGCETIVQRERHVEDSQELFRGDTIRVGGGKNHDLDLVSKLAENSSDAIDFLKDEIGLPLTDLLQLGGHSAARTHRLSTHAPIGFTMMQALATRVSALPNIEVRTSSNVLELSFRDEEAGRVICGLTYEESGTGAGTGADTAASVSTPAELEADAVIITAGGSAFDQSADGLMVCPHACVVH